MNNSTIYSIGTVLDRARDSDLPVEVLAEGQWFAGQVMLVDGHGLVLDSGEHGYAVIRIANIAAVRVADPTMACTGGLSAVPQAPSPWATPSGGY